MTSDELHRRTKVDVSMSEVAIDAFLGRPGQKLQLATINVDGTPHLTTMYYVVQDGCIAFWTYIKSLKSRNIARDPRVTTLVEDGDRYEELRGVAVTGVATSLPAGPNTLSLGIRLYEHNRGHLAAEARDRVNRQAPKRIGYLVEPRTVRSWDHRRLVKP